ncbi:hypothetical protein FSP39_000996 [Pinctada imbricata]|uniref:CWH43-like N-terminal domain-containing protein n=1 Tax=Pinctada imbricata TaxID=66713 RepID=A0AA88YA96_PINIB|nr:hypothetical protein FSP39_000996 [Pinctada imbricata]
MLAANAEMRYLFLREVLEKVNERKSHWTRLNFAGLVLGLTASFGLLLVGCFQVDTMKPPHYIGAFLCFVVAIVYIWVQVALSFKLRRLYGENRTRERKIWKAFRWLVFIYQVLCGIAASILLDVLRGVFLLSTSTEWLLAFSVMFFIQSFIPGFRRLRQININVSLEDSMVSPICYTYMYYILVM